MRNRLPREFYIPKGAIKVSDKRSSAIAYIYEGPRGPGAVAFHGRADKPDWHFRFADAQRRAKRIADHFANIQARDSATEERREKRKAFTHGVQVGDIYRTSWGYDQTNVEFFQVVDVKGKYAVLREIETASEARGMGSDSVVPQSDAFMAPRYQGDDQGLPIRRLIQDGNIKIDEVRRAWPWGKRGPGGIVIGDACHRTASGWGH